MFDIECDEHIVIKQNFFFLLKILFIFEAEYTFNGSQKVQILIRNVFTANFHVQKKASDGIE